MCDYAHHINHVVCMHKCYCLGCYVQIVTFSSRMIENYHLINIFFGGEQINSVSVYATFL